MHTNPTRECGARRGDCKHLPSSMSAKLTLQKQLRASYVAEKNSALNTASEGLSTGPARVRVSGFVLHISVLDAANDCFYDS